MDEREAKYFCLLLMEKPWEVYVSTIDENGYPDTRAMDNLRSKERFPRLTNLFKSNKDDFWILLSTNTLSAKMQHIKRNPAICVYYCEPRQFHGAMLNGQIEVVEDNKLKHALWQDYWTQYYPKGVDGPDYSVLSLHPAHVKGWDGSSFSRFEFTLERSSQQPFK